MHDMELDPIEVEYLYGRLNDNFMLAEFDKRARERYQKRRGDKFTLDSLIRHLDCEYFGEPYFRRIVRMDLSPRDLVIRVRYPGGVSDTFDWSIKRTVFTTPSISVTISENI